MVVLSLRDNAVGYDLPVVSPPRLSGKLTEVTSLERGVEEGGIVSDTRYDRCHFAGIEVVSAEVSTCRFVGTSFAGASFASVVGRDTAVENCDLANVALDGCSWVRMNAQGCRMTGSLATHSGFTDVTFSHCILDGSTLRYSKLRDVLFDNCTLQGVLFDNVDAVNMNFRNCNLLEAQFSGMKISSASFVECSMFGVRGVSQLAGAIVDSASAIDLLPTMAGELGIKIDG